MTNKISRRVARRRQLREFNRAFDKASPAMQQELVAAAARSGFYSR
ncbi:hypothetical protein SAMN05443575_1791 [Jatrophihabitans endophyticus]|uniref:Uncharacterized protein n=1 Tax=Jatrophihabitans endophyticus TaxID=1206085 RepID=A0A1M5I817_9ACTN|nr:hypothetical protein [Jatrophihabitans endophyticus]SHG24402.1 hypothetical protein SAMN05443575_1791 [Jatrophihabitans endophyticus]